MGVICPLCGDATSLSPVVIEDERAYLVDKSSEHRSIFTKARISAITDDNPPHYVSYGVFKCVSCGERFVAKKHNWLDEDWVVVYPISHKAVSEEMPEPIKGEFGEANLCFAIGAYRACVLMCQIALEALWRDRNVSGLNELKSQGIISSNLYDRANEVRLWGNVAKHEPITDVVEKEDAGQLLCYLEVILNDIYVEPKRLDSIAKKREQLGKKE